MKADLITAANIARSQRQAVMLFTPFDGTEPQLWTPDATPLVDDKTHGEALRTGKARMVETDEHSGFLQVFLPPPRLLIVGGVHIAQALVPLAQSLAYDVTLIDPRSAFASLARFPNTALDGRWPDEAFADLGLDGQTAVVALSHDPKIDDPALIFALKAKPAYIGALGSRKTHAGRVERLGEEGFSDSDIARIKSPIGLDIGAVSPAEIAVSIMAEITATFRQRA